MKRLLIGPLLLLFCVLPAAAQNAAPSASQDLDVEWAQDVDFSQYHSFGIAGPDDYFIDAALEQRMINAATQELQAKGLHWNNFQDQYDLALAYGGRVEQDPARPELRRVLVWFRLVDTKQNVLVWHGSGAQQLTGDDKQDIAIGRSLMAAIFAQYPPTK
jgi:hypothetical protein